jgi:hypothetical protein
LVVRVPIVVNNQDVLLMLLLVADLKDFKRGVVGDLRLAVQSFQYVQLIFSARLCLRGLLE